MIAGASQSAVRSRSKGPLPDRLGPDVRLLLCGINPGLHSAASGHHYAGPGNRFWPALHEAGLTPALYTPQQDIDLPALGIGLTNLVHRSSARAAELTRDELNAGAARLSKLVDRLRPRITAVLGLGAYRSAFARPKATVGIADPQDIERTELWVLPNPSGLNGHYSVADHARLLAEVGRRAGLIDAT